MSKVKEDSVRYESKHDDLSSDSELHKKSSTAPTRIVKLDRKRKSKEKKNPSQHRNIGDIKKKKSTTKHKEKGSLRYKVSKEEKLPQGKSEESPVTRDKEQEEERVKSGAEKKLDSTSRILSSPINIDISDDENIKHEDDDAHSHLSLSVHSNDGVDDDLKSSKRDDADHEEHDDSLDIKPPQVQAGRKEKSRKRKHKDDKRHERDQYARERDWEARDRPHHQRDRDFRDREWDHRDRSDRYQQVARHDKVSKHHDRRPERPLREDQLDPRPDRRVEKGDPDRRVEKVDRQDRVVKSDRHDRINKQDRPSEHYERTENVDRLVRNETGHERPARPDVWDRLDTTNADRTEKRVERKVRMEKERSTFDDVPRAYAPEGGLRDKQKSDESIESREARKREESQRERDRLERLERERQRERDRRAREEQEEKDREEREIKRRKQKEQIRHLTHRGDGASKREDSRNQKKGRKRSRSREDNRESNDRKVEMKGRSTNKLEPAGPRTPEIEYEHHVEPDDIASPDAEIEEDEKLEESMDEEEHSETEGSQEETESDTDTDSDSEDSEVSESVSSVESESEEEVEPEEMHEEEVEKLTSKFDDQHSENENEASAMSEDEDRAQYEVASPPISPIELKPQLPPYYPAIQGCRNVEEFNCLNRIEEGTYGIVYRAKDKKTGDIVALKRIKIEREKEGFPITSLREINTLLKAQHSNIVTVREIVVGSNMDKIYIVMDYVEHDLKALMETMKQPFLVGEVKTLMIQLLRAVAHLHDNWILHRDLKTSNLLLSHKGILKVGDFGLAREYGSPLKRYTPIVVTLWYRSPELLLGVKEYSTAVDMWSVGCVFAELLTMKPLWPGKSEIDQLNRIFKDLGTPSEKIWPGVHELSGMKKCTFTQYSYNTIRTRFGSYLTNSGFDLLNRFLTYNPKKRVTAATSLKHEYFQESPLPVEPSMFPTWPAKSEQTRRHVCSPKPPSGGQAFAKLMGDEEQVISSSSGFHFAAAKSQGVSAVGPGFNLKF